MHSYTTPLSRDYPRMNSCMPLPPCPSIPGFPSNLAISGLSQDGQPYAPRLSKYPGIHKWPSQDYPRMDSHIPPLSKYPRIPEKPVYPGIIPRWTSIAPPCPSIPGFPSNLAIPGLSQDAQPFTPLSKYPGIHK